MSAMSQLEASNVFELPLNRTEREVTERDQQLQRVIPYFGELTVHNSDITYELRMPENQKYGAIAMLAPGFGGVKSAMDPLGDELAQRGMANVTWTPGRWGKTWLADLLRPQDLHVDTMHGITNHMANNLSIIRRKAPNPELIDPFKKFVITHSMGGFAGTRYTAEVEDSAESEDVIEAILHLAAAGFGNPKLSQLATDVPLGIYGGVKHELVPFIGQQTQQGRRNETAKDVKNYFGTNLVRVVGEAISCLTGDVRSVSRSLRAPSTYYGLQHDILVRTNSSVAQHVGEYEELEGMGHLAVQMKVAKIADKVIEAYERSTERQLASVSGN